LFQDAGLLDHAREISDCFFADDGQLGLERLPNDLGQVAAMRMRKLGTMSHQSASFDGSQIALQLGTGMGATRYRSRVWKRWPFSIGHAVI
jgi:hypothetical protein